MSIFAPIITDAQVETAFTNTLVKWIGTYLAEVERQSPSVEPGNIPRPRSWNKSFDLDNWPEDQQPSVHVLCAGTDEVEHRRAGEYGAWFDVAVGAFVSARDEASTRELAQLYTAAITSAVIQHASLEGFAQNTYFVGRSYDFPDEDNRTLRLGVVRFRVFVDGVVTAGAGPIQPDPKANELEPYDEWPIATTVTTPLSNLTD